MQPLDLVRAAPWKRSLFTTYALSLSFFEAVVMDAFVRGGGRSPLILCDTDGVRNALSEMGARLVGREYELLPVHQEYGVFHPKISLFQDDESAHLIVGSGNLTFGGWGGNAELIEHFHSGNEPQVLEDAADFLELLAIEDSIDLPGSDRIAEHSDELRAKIRGRTGSGRVRLLHNLGQTIGERIVEEAAELGGAERICLKSPFYDGNGRGLLMLAEHLGCEEVFGYVHVAGEVLGTGSENWPHLASDAIRAVGTDQPLYDDGRRLHAKSIEVLCRKGRLVITGSANATHAGLYGPNSEASVLRIFPDRSGAWTLSATTKPAKFAMPEGDAEADLTAKLSVISAELKGRTIQGAILGSWPSQIASVSCEVAGETFGLGDVVVQLDGSFKCDSDRLAEQAWKAGRVVVELTSNGRTARGFLSVKAVADLAKRTGAAGARILAILAGTDTPRDVAAIISWFNEDPDRIPRADGTASGSGETAEIVDEIVAPSAFDQRAIPLEQSDHQNPGNAGFDHAMRALLNVFRTSRGAFDEEAQAARERGELSKAEENDLVRNARLNDRTLDSFEGLLRVSLDARHRGAHSETMLALSHYLADRLNPPESQISGWLERIRHALPHTLSQELAADVLVMEATMLASSPSVPRAVKARRFLRRLGLLPLVVKADLDRLPAFARSLPQVISRNEAFQMVVAVRTAGEELELLLAAREQDVLPALPTLEQHPHWDKIRQLHLKPAARQNLETVDEPRPACPRCHMVLARAAFEDLQTYEVAKCTNRCGRLIAVRATS